MDKYAIHKEVEIQNMKSVMGNIDINPNEYNEAELAEIYENLQDNLANTDYDNIYQAELEFALKKFDEEHSTHKQIEVCPHCEKEVEITWNVYQNGYEIFCPHCGKRMMLCDACMHSPDNAGAYCDWCEEKGCFRRNKNE